MDGPRDQRAVVRDLNKIGKVADVDIVLKVALFARQAQAVGDLASDAHSPTVSRGVELGVCKADLKQ